VPALATPVVRTRESALASARRISSQYMKSLPATSLGVFRTAAVIRQYFVAEVKGHHARNEIPIPGHGHYLAVGAEDLAQGLEVALRKYRGAEAVDALRIGGEKRSTPSSTSLFSPALIPLRTMARCLRGISSRLCSTSGAMFFLKVT